MARLFSFITAFMLCFTAAYPFDLKDLKNALGGDDKTSATIAGVLGDLLSRDRLTIADITGTWAYSAPAICFKSENLFQKAGGSAMAASLEKRLTPYYKMAGLDRMTLSIDADSSFVMNVKGISLTGTIASATEVTTGSNFTFNFKALRSVNIGTLNAYVVKSATGELDVMFDISRLIELVDKLSTITKNSTVGSAVKVLKSYDGLCAGFTMAKSK